MTSLEPPTLLESLQARPLADLMSEACALRAEGHGRNISYSRKVFIPLTRLCRNVCGYCTFVRGPKGIDHPYLLPDEVLEIARLGREAGCREALFTLGDRPEAVHAVARSALESLGCRSTVEYLGAMCALVLEKTGLLPHVNPGVLSGAEIAALRPVSVSQGMMLESTAARLCAVGGPHHGCPDKVPALRLEAIEAAGRANVPFTSGILIGIGETRLERIEALLALRDAHARHGHLQEVIVQNFRAKPAIPMSHWPEPSRGTMLRALGVARLLLREMNIQAPPNLSAPDYEGLLDAGLNDWGGVSPLTPDYINPEAPWPHLAELERRTERAGFRLRQRLPVYPEFLPAAVGVGGLLAEKLRAAADAEGYARSEA